MSWPKQLGKKRSKMYPRRKVRRKTIFIFSGILYQKPLKNPSPPNFAIITKQI